MIWMVYQVTSELMHKLTKENIVAKKQPVKGRRPTQRPAAPKPSIEPSEVLKPDIQLPYYPGFLSALPGISKEQIQEQPSSTPQHDLVPIYEVLEATVSNSTDKCDSLI